MKKFIFSLDVVFLASAVFFAFIFIAWTQYPYEYSLISNNISRLGRVSMNPDGYIFSFVGTASCALLMVGFYRSLSVWKVGERRIDILVNLLTPLGYLACAFLLGIAIFHADFHLAHKVLGGFYFSLDMILMALGMVLAYRHPRIDNIVILICVASAALDIIYLISDAKWSWAEWASVTLSFAVAGWLAINSRRLQSERNGLRDTNQRGIVS